MDCLSRNTEFHSHLRQLKLGLSGVSRVVFHYLPNRRIHFEDIVCTLSVKCLHTLCDGWEDAAFGKV